MKPKARELQLLVELLDQAGPQRNPSLQASQLHQDLDAPAAEVEQVMHIFMSGIKRFGTHRFGETTSHLVTALKIRVTEEFIQSIQETEQKTVPLYCI